MNPPHLMDRIGVNWNFTANAWGKLGWWGNFYVDPRYDTNLSSLRVVDFDPLQIQLALRPDAGFIRSTT